MDFLKTSNSQSHFPAKQKQKGRRCTQKKKEKKRAHLVLCVILSFDST
jgi:hypothetical protein